jgi:hypothetical protein
MSAEGDEMSAIPDEVLVCSAVALLPGDGLVEFPWLGPVFKSLGAKRVEGIDYSAFKIYGVWNGCQIEFGGGDGPWPATDLFEKWDVPMKVLQKGIIISIQLHNESDRPQRFAVKLVGLRLK